MDLNDIWQQHKTWILGVLGGLLLFFIAQSMISNTYSTTSFRGQIAKANKELKKEHFSTQQKAAAERKKVELTKRLSRLRAKLEFKPRDDFLLEGKQRGPAVYYLRQEGMVRSKLVEAMESTGVEFGAEDLGMPSEPPIGRDEKQLYLHGLDLIDDSLTRLLDAAAEATDRDPDAHGLRAVESIKLETGSRTGRSGRGSRRGRGQEVKRREVMASVKLRCDSLTLQIFLERMLGNDSLRPLVISDIEVVDKGDRPGQPLVVTLELKALLPMSPKN